MEEVFDTSGEEGEIQTLHENVQDFVQISEHLAEDKTLTQEIAIESIPVLGHNGLLDAYFSTGNKKKRYAIATESLQKRMSQLFRQAYDLLRRIVKKCIEWAKRLFGGAKRASVKTKEEVRGAEASVRLVVSAAQEAKELKEARTFKDVVQEHKLDTEFTSSLTPTEFDLFVDGPYMKAIQDLAKELEHGGALAEISTNLGELDEWFKKAVQDAAQKDAAGVEFGEQHAGMYYDEKSEALANSNRSHTDAVMKLFWVAKDLKDDHLGGRKPVEKLYDLVGMSNELERVISRISVNDVGPLIDRWNGVLVSLQAQFDASEKSAMALDEQTSHEEEEGNSVRHRQALASQYLNAIGSFDTRILNLQQALILVEQYLYQDSFNLYYRILGYLNKAAAAYQHEEPSEETYRLFTMTRDILSKRHGKAA